MEESKKMKMLLIVVNAGFADEVMATAREAGARGATILNARGGAEAQHEVFIGISVAAEKEMIVCVLDEETAESVMTVVREKAGADTPARSVCFTMPIDKAIGITRPADSGEKKDGQ